MPIKFVNSAIYLNIKHIIGIAIKNDFLKETKSHFYLQKKLPKHKKASWQ
jgi:hypothetical protein